MKTLAQLRADAEKLARVHKHKDIKYKWTDNWNITSSTATCSKCEAWVTIEVESGNIYGPAVEVACADCVQRIYKRYSDCLGTSVDLESVEIGTYTEGKNTYRVWKPVHSSWSGSYRLEALVGKAVKNLVIGLSTCGMYAYEWEEKNVVKP